MQKYNLIQPTESNRFSLFAADLEDDQNILFHATPKVNFEEILDEGFLSASEKGTGILKSVSYAFRSSGCLAHLNGRFDQDFVVFAVRFEDLNQKGIVINPSDVHVYSGIQPEIVGYCEIPKDFSYS